MQPGTDAIWYDVSRLTARTDSLPRWNLECPAVDQPCERLDGGRIRVRGWLVPPPEIDSTAAGIAIRVEGITRCYPLNRWRGDVIKKVLALDPERRPELMLGFDWALEEVSEFDFGLDLAGELRWVRRLHRRQGGRPA